MSKDLTQEFSRRVRRLGIDGLEPQPHPPSLIQIPGASIPSNSGGLRVNCDPSDCPGDLLDTDPAYVTGLRVLVLRVMARTPALANIQSRPLFELARACEFLGLEDFEEWMKDRPLQDARRNLEVLIHELSRHVPVVDVFPPLLRRNLAAIGELAGLSEVEQAILGFGIMLHAEPIFTECCELLGSGVPPHTLPRIIATVMELPPTEVQRALESNGRLATVGLLTVDSRTRYELTNLIDLPNTQFAFQMAASHMDVRNLVREYVRLVDEPKLVRDDFAEVAEFYDATLAYLRAALDDGRGGVNILVYGRPGTGKSQFARAVARDLQVELFEVAQMSMSGGPVSPARRVRNFRMAQAFYKGTRKVLLFDECEEVLDQVDALGAPEEGSAAPRKSWINHALENNLLPTIWIANSVGGFDDAYLRRFDICFEMPMPGERKRREVIESKFRSPLGDAARNTIARHSGISPAMLDKASAVVDVVCTPDDKLGRDDLAIKLLNQQLRAQGFRPIDVSKGAGVGGGDFNPDLINTEADLSVLRSGLARSGEGRVCLFGPPGTGKTAFGRWIAESLDRPHMLLRASDLLAPHLGETEERIATAFEDARRRGAVLQFDEVDGFLQSRRSAERNWEITQVNEMLTQMERFEGIFIASTNLMDRIDEAAHRRFDLVLRFGYLKPAASRALFVRLCALLGVEPGIDIEGPALDAIINLTPGDFEQVFRRSALLRPADSHAVLEGLRTACRNKKDGHSRPAGFTTKVA